MVGTVSVGGYRNEGDPAGLSIGGDNPENNATVEAFWALLKRAGYEEI